MKYGYASLPDRRVTPWHVRLEPGLLVAHDHRAWRIVEVRERPVDLWDAQDEADHQRYVDTCGPVPPERWPQRPMVVVARPDLQPDAEPTHLIAAADHVWEVLDERYSACVRCGELPPCRHAETEKRIAGMMARIEKLMAVQAGCCLQCGEPVTSRTRKMIVFPGANLWRPDMSDRTAAFHHKECAWAAADYDQAWAAAEPGRREHFRCSGSEVEHRDGARECDNPDCPRPAPGGMWVDHAGGTRYHSGTAGCWCDVPLGVRRSAASVEAEGQQ